MMKKPPNQSSFNFLSIDVWFHGHPSQRNGQNGHLKKNRRKKKKFQPLLKLLLLVNGWSYQYEKLTK